MAGQRGGPRGVAWRAGFTLAVVALALLARFALIGVLPPAGFPFLTFFPAVVMAALFCGLEAGLVASLLSTLCARYFFIAPFHSLAVATHADGIALGFFLAVVLVDCIVIHLMQRSLRQVRLEKARVAELSAEREAITAELQRRLAELGAALAEAQQARAALAQSEARLRTIVETVPVGLVMAELPSGRILGGNAYVEKLLRHPVLLSPELHSYGGWVSYHADGRQVRSDEYPLARMVLESEENPSLEVHYQRGDGSRRWMRIMARPVRDAQGALIGGVVAVMDVDGEISAARALALSEARLRLAQQAAGVGVFECRPLEGEAYWSASLFSLYGLDPGAPPPGLQASAGHLALVHPEDRERLRREHDAAMAVPHVPGFAAEFRIIRADTGAVRWIASRGEFLRDAAGRAVLVRGGQHDITDRRLAELALRESEATLRTVLDALPVGVALADLKGRIVRSNAAHRAFCHAPPPDVPEPFSGPARAGLEKALRQGGATRDEVVEYRLVLGGERRHCLSNIVPVRNAEGRITAAVIALVDITDRLRMEEKLRATERDLQHLGRRTMIGAMASGIAHELNQPLGAAGNYLSGALRLLAQEGEAPAGPAPHPQVLHALEKAGAQVQRAGEILRRLRGFIDGGAQPRRLACVATVVREATALALSGLPEIRPEGVDYLLDGTAGQAALDPVQIQQVVVNLVRNALEAMQDQPPGQPRRLSVGAGALGPAVEIWVADTGCGLPEAVAAQLFEPFRSTKAQGMGIGLSICRTIVEAHGGRILAQARPGGGTVFRLTLAREGGVSAPLAGGAAA